MILTNVGAANGKYLKFIADGDAIAYPAKVS